MGIAVFVGFHARIFELLESMATFIKGLGRARWFKVQVRALMAKKQSMKSVVKAVEKRGFKLMILIRLAPYPFNVMNALLSATHIPLSTFAFATALSLTKLALHVYIGSTLSSLAPTIPPTNENEIPGGGNDGGDMDPLPDNPHGRALKIVVMVVSMIIGIAVGAYVWIVAKREIEASEGIRIERRRKRRESLRQSRAFQRSSLGGITAGRGSARAGHHLLPRGGSSGGMDLTDIDLASGHGNEGSDFVGGGAMYDYPDEDEGQEDQALVGGGAGAELHARAASGSSPTSRLEYGSDSEESDYLDEDDDGDMSDMERGINDEQALLQDSADMDMCNLPSSHRQPNYHHSHSQLRGTEQETMGWFAQNGVDMSDRVW
ncbi:hypothetical protein EDD11_007384 [Mortierella claussenii]|nr:hypothetical protein EDD11_007384 [Mortierella claussenii]